MSDAAHTTGASQTTGAMAAAIEASAAALPPNVSDNRTGGSLLDLEPAVMEASLFGRLAHYAICYLGFEHNEPPNLTPADTELVYWAVTGLRGRADATKAAFVELCEAERRARNAALQKAAS